MDQTNATLGERIKAARSAKKISQAKLAEMTGLTARAIRYYEADQRGASAEVIKKLSDALGVTPDYFMDEVSFREQLEREEFLSSAKERYGSRGKAQAKRLLDETSALFAGGELSLEDQAAFMEEMKEIFNIAKEEAKIYTPKKYMKNDAD